MSAAPTAPATSRTTPSTRRVRTTSQLQTAPQAPSGILTSGRRDSGTDSTARPLSLDPDDTSGTAAPRPGRVTIIERTTSNELKSGSASPVLPDTVVSTTATLPTTELRAGLIQKPFQIPTALLLANAPYFADLASEKNAKRRDVSIDATESTTLPGPYFYPDLDEYAMALFLRWLYAVPSTTAQPTTTSNTGTLHGPTDFHSMNHYLCLYVLGLRFRIEPLRNTVLDLVRGYYRRENMTAPAFRLDYIYSATESACAMRRFLIGTAAYRAVADAEGARVDEDTEHDRRGLSESMKGVIRQGGELSVDFVEACLALGADAGGRKDARRGADCEWHDHCLTGRCGDVGAVEPWEKT